jgi:aspartate kinase
VWAKLEVGLKQEVVVKVGGSLIKKPQDIDIVLRMLDKNILANTTPIIVVSAVKGITDLLVSLCNGDRFSIDKVVEIHRNFVESLGLDRVKEYTLLLERELIKYGDRCSEDSRARDRVLSIGERFSAQLFAEMINSMGYRAYVAWPWEIGLITNNRFGDASPIVDVSLDNIGASISKIVASGYIPVIPGFIGVTQEGDITTMGRGSSDLTAVLVARALKTSRLYLFTETPGIMTADPKIVPNARTVDMMDFAEGGRASKYRVKGLNRKTFEYISDYDGVIMVLDLFMRGTKICRTCSKPGIKVITPFEEGASIIGWGSGELISKVAFRLSIDCKINFYDDLEAIIYSKTDPYILVREVHREVFGI